MKYIVYKFVTMCFKTFNRYAISLYGEDFQNMGVLTTCPKYIHHVLSENNFDVCENPTEKMDTDSDNTEPSTSDDHKINLADIYDLLEPIYGGLNQKITKYDADFSNRYLTNIFDRYHRLFEQIVRINNNNFLDFFNNRFEAKKTEYITKNIVTSIFADQSSFLVHENFKPFFLCNFQKEVDDFKHNLYAILAEKTTSLLNEIEIDNVKLKKMNPKVKIPGVENFRSLNAVTFTILNGIYKSLANEIKNIVDTQVFDVYEGISRVFDPIKLKVKILAENHFRVLHDRLKSCIVRNDLAVKFQNYIFYKDFFTISSDFTEKYGKLFYLRATPYKFSRFNTFGNFIKEKVNEHMGIKHIRRIPRLYSANEVIVVNCLNFFCEWKFPFNLEKTKKKKFRAAYYGSNGFEELVNNVNIMCQTNRFKYGENDLFQIIELEYAMEEFSFVAVIPKEDVILKRVTDFFIEDNNFCKTMESMQEKVVELELPSFIGYIDFEYNFLSPHFTHVEYSFLNLVVDEFFENAIPRPETSTFLKQGIFILNEWGTCGYTDNSHKYMHQYRDLKIAPEAKVSCTKPFLYLITYKTKGSHFPITIGVRSRFA